MIGKSIDSRVQDNIMANMGNPARLKQEVSREISDPRITPDMAKLLASRTLDDLLGALTRENQRASQTPPSLKDQADGKLRNKIEMLMGKTSAQQPMGIPSAMPTQMGRVGNSVAAVNQMAMRKAQPPRVPTPQGGIRQPMPQAQPPRGNPPVMKREGGILAFAEGVGPIQGGRPDITNEQLDLLGLTIEEYNALSPEEAQLKLDIVRGGLANPVPEYTDEEKAQDAEKVDSLLAEIDAKTYSTDEERNRLLAEMGKKKGEEDKKNKTDELTSNQMGPPSKKGLKSIPRSLDKKLKEDPIDVRGLAGMAKMFDRRADKKERKVQDMLGRLERLTPENQINQLNLRNQLKDAGISREEINKAVEAKFSTDTGFKGMPDNKIPEGLDLGKSMMGSPSSIVAEDTRDKKIAAEAPPIETDTTDTTDTTKTQGIPMAGDVRIAQLPANVATAREDMLFKTDIGKKAVEDEYNKVIADRRKRLEAMPDQRKLAGMLGVANAGFGQNPLTAGATAMADYGTRRAADIERFLQETEELGIESKKASSNLDVQLYGIANDAITSYVNSTKVEQMAINQNSENIVATFSAKAKTLVDQLKVAKEDERELIKIVGELKEEITKKFPELAINKASLARLTASGKPDPKREQELKAKIKDDEDRINYQLNAAYQLTGAIDNITDAVKNRQQTVRGLEGQLGSMFGTSTGAGSNTLRFDAQGNPI